MTVSAGQVCNSILIESKVTKNWDNKWLPKLRADMERENAVFGVLVSDALPSTKSSALMMVIFGYAAFMNLRRLPLPFAKV